MRVAAVVLAVGILIAAGIWWSLRPASHPVVSPVAEPVVSAPVASAKAVVVGDGGAKSASTAAPPSELAASGGWGSGAGQFGRRHDPESNPEAPMAVTVAPDGTLLILDQINHRVQRWKNGKLVGSMQFGSETVQDLVSGPEGRTVLLDRLADRNVQVYDPAGKLLNEVSIIGSGITEGGGVTAVFADDDGIYVEREHGVVVRIADVNGHSLPERTEMLGRPSRDGKMLLTAALADRAAGTVTVRAFDRKTSTVLWTATANLGAPLLHIISLDSDLQGAVYVSAVTGAENAAFQIVDEALAVTRVVGGQQRGLLTLPPFASADETFKPIAVADDGTVYVEYPSDAGVEVRRYRF